MPTGLLYWPKCNIRTCWCLFNYSTKKKMAVVAKDAHRVDGKRSEGLPLPKKTLQDCGFFVRDVSRENLPSTSSSQVSHDRSKQSLKRKSEDADDTKDLSEDSCSEKKWKGNDRPADGNITMRPKIPNICTALSSQHRPLKAENLLCDYYPNFFTKKEADDLFRKCEESLEYFTGELATVKLYGKNIPIPRKQTAHGDEGLTYTYSGITVPAKPWLPVLDSVRQRIEEKTSFKFNFVLINRYKDGKDSIGEHRDDEKDLDRTHPIASLSLGQTRDFIFRHMDTRGKKKTRDIEPVKVELEHGSLLMMNHPTNRYWYHSLPRRPEQSGVRINMTFRRIQTEKKFVVRASGNQFKKAKTDRNKC